MSRRAKRANIMFLPGVFEKDLIIDDKMITEKFSEAIYYYEAPPLETKYIALPRTYTTPTSWVKSTNLHCWECDRQFRGCPIFISGARYIKEGERTIDVHGNFCSFNCAQKYIDEHYTGATRDDKTRDLLNLHKEITGRDAILIKPAPEKTLMKKYCGEDGVNAIEFQRLLEEVQEEYQVEHYRLDHIYQNQS